MRKVAAYCGTRNLYHDMVTAAKSLLIHSDVDKIYFLIEDDEIPNYVLPDVIECRNVSNQTYFNNYGPNITTTYTYMAMMRAALALEFPDEDLMLSLDVDTIIDKDISSLWEEYELGDEYYFAAAIEPSRSTYGLIYTNHGVVLYNLRKLREDKKALDVIKGLNTHYYPYVDQDAMNYYCQGHIKEMSPLYNSNSFVKRHVVNNRKIIHYAGLKQWNHYSEVLKYRNIKFDEIVR